MNKYSGLQINKATLSDIPQIARIHKEGFSRDHTLTYFSIKTIGNYYFEFINKPHVIFWVCKKDNELIGFVLGGESNILQKARRDFQIHNYYEVIWECIKNINNITFVKKIISAYYNSLKNKLEKTNHSSEHEVISDTNIRMLSIAVKKSYQGKGIGALLLNTFERQIKQFGISKYGLSVRKQNMPAIKFYASMGFKVHKESNAGLYYYKDL